MEKGVKAAGIGRKDQTALGGEAGHGAGERRADEGVGAAVGSHACKLAKGAVAITRGTVLANSRP